MTALHVWVELPGVDAYPKHTTSATELRPSSLFLLSLGVPKILTSTEKFMEKP